MELFFTVTVGGQTDESTSLEEGVLSQKNTYGIGKIRC
jgi:hypothetical protein